ncbi:hypothetical protein Tco_0248515, partial [Tanacetum coccineum]
MVIVGESVVIGGVRIGDVVYKSTGGMLETYGGCRDVTVAIKGVSYNGVRTEGS